MKSCVKWREFVVYSGFGIERSWLHEKIGAMLEYLAPQMEPMFQENWDDRHLPSNPCSAVFGNVIGSVDTVPVRVRRQRKKSWSSALYVGGKYKAHVLKFQASIKPYMAMSGIRMRRWE